MSQQLERDSSEEQKFPINNTDYTLDSVDSAFQSEYDESTPSYRVDKLTETVETQLETVKIRDVEVLNTRSVVLSVERDGEKEKMDFYSRKSTMEPKIADLMSVTDAKTFANMEGEEIEVLPVEDSITGCSDMKNRVKRNLKILALEKGLCGQATSEHPYDSKGRMTPTAKSIAVLSGFGVSSGLLLTALAQPSYAVSIGTAPLLTEVAFTALSIISILSVTLGILFAALSSLYVLFGEDSL